MDGNEQDPCHLHRSGSCLHHRAWAPRRWPGLGLSAVAVPLPMLLCLAVLSRSGPAERGARLPVHGTLGHFLGVRRRWPSLTMQVGLKYTYLYCTNDCCCAILYLYLYGSCALPVSFYSPVPNTEYSAGMVQIFCTFDWIFNCLPPFPNKQRFIKSIIIIKINNKIIRYCPSVRRGVVLPSRPKSWLLRLNT